MGHQLSPCREAPWSGAAELDRVRRLSFIHESDAIPMYYEPMLGHYSKARTVLAFNAPLIRRQLLSAEMDNHFSSKCPYLSGQTNERITHLLEKISLFKCKRFTSEIRCDLLLLM
jgi:hypothetical protein